MIKDSDMDVQLPDVDTVCLVHSTLQDILLITV